MKMKMNFEKELERIENEAKKEIDCWFEKLVKPHSSLDGERFNESNNKLTDYIVALLCIELDFLVSPRLKDWDNKQAESKQEQANKLVRNVETHHKTVVKEEREERLAKLLQLKENMGKASNDE